MKKRRKKLKNRLFVDTVKRKVSKNLSNWHIFFSIVRTRSLKSHVSCKICEKHDQYDLIAMNDKKEHVFIMYCCCLSEKMISAALKRIEREFRRMYGRNASHLLYKTVALLIFHSVNWPIASTLVGAKGFFLIRWYSSGKQNMNFDKKNDIFSMIYLNMNLK